jgi:hypothetical protein
MVCLTIFFSRGTPKERAAMPMHLTPKLKLKKKKERRLLDIMIPKVIHDLHFRKKK